MALSRENLRAFFYWIPSYLCIFGKLYLDFEKCTALVKKNSSFDILMFYLVSFSISISIPFL